MNFEVLLQYAPYIFQLLQAAPDLKTLIDRGATPDSIRQLVPQLVPLLEQFGAHLFPKVAPELHTVAVVMTAFDPNVTKWLQGSLNKLLTPSPNLVVDGVYGAATRGAVEQVQTKLGLKVDGWAGKITNAAIALALGKLAGVQLPTAIKG